MASFQEINVDEVLTCIKRTVRLAQTEEDLRVRASGCIEEKILKPLGIAQIGKYEYTFVSGGRADALYGHVIIEYKAPGKLSAERDIAKAKEQVIKYIMKEAEVETRYKNFLGIIISDRIAFVRYNPITKQWMLRGPYDINRETTIKLIEAIRGLRRKKLGVEELLTDFGKHPKTKKMSPLAEKAVKTLYNKLLQSKNPRVRVLFEDWKRLFTQATGYSPRKLKGLEKEYGIQEKDINYDALLFAIHTYYALIMKLLAAEIAYLYGTGRWLKSYISEVEDAYMRGVEELRRTLEELESGGVFKRFLSITNFIEGDYFSWYLDELDQELADVIAEIAGRLADYEPATPQLEPESTRDLLKRLYQHLVPKKIRHDLGEYYTPDWLAELVLDEVGYTEEYFEELAKEDPIAPFKLRLLDPASGSGTFLIMAIKRLRNYAEKHFMLDIMVDYVLRNIVGYDLNPLAVLAARTNYLLSIADILPYTKGEKEIPIYLADSILVESRTALYGSFYILRTTVGNFEIPKEIVDSGLLGEFLNLIESSVRNLYTSDEFLEMFKTRIEPKLKKNTNIDYSSLKNLYKTFIELEKSGKNHVWVSIIRNAFAPLLKGKFDYVVGNPPWVNWENLPETYRNITKKLWDDYDLTIIKGKTGLGKVKRDLAMLFLVRTLHLYLKDGGRHGFLIPLTLFKTQAGAGFRKFLAKGKKVNDTLVKGRVEVVHDLVTLYPFEGAINRTALIVLKKGEETTFPVRHIVWDNPSGRPIDPEAALEEVKKITKRYEISLIPLEGPKKPESSWMQVMPEAYEALSKIIAKTNIGQHYRAHAGVNTALNQIYWVQIKDKGSDNLVLITNPPLPGQKKKVRQVEALVEADLVYPLIRGREVKKWYVESDLGYILIPHDPKTGKPLPEHVMKIKYPKAYEYFLNFKRELETRSIHKLWGKGNPFYSVYDIGSYTFYPYKVVWKYIAGAIRGKAEFSCAVLEPITDKYVGAKTVIPNEKLMLVPFNNADEAHYLSAILNSSFIRALVASYIIETAVSTHILDNVYVPKFNPSNELHRHIIELSKRAHRLAKEIIEHNRKNLEEELRRVELEIDRLVASLYGIPEMSVRAVRKLLHILLGEEYEEEGEEEVVESIEAKPSVQFLHTIVKANVEDYFEVYVTNLGEYKVKISIESSWGKEEFEVAEKEWRTKVNVPPLAPGKYAVKYTVLYNGEREEGEFVIEAKLEGPRRARRGLADLV